MITTDGEQIEVMQAYTSPLPWGMTCHIANLFLHAFEGTEDAPTLADMLEDSTEEIADSFDSGDNDAYATGNYMEIELDASGKDDINAFFNVNGLDYNTNYEIDLVLTDSDGITQDVDTFAFSNDYYYDNSYMSSDSWGEHCLTAKLENADNGQVIETLDVCVNVPQDIEPSQLLEDIAEGFSESTLENVMENFGENLEYRMEDYEADFPYDDGDMFVLWDTNSNMVVGFQMIVTSDDSNLWYTLIGPESDSYGTAPAPLSVTYFSGSQAIVQEAEIVEDTTLADLVDLTQHNDDIIEDALEDALADLDEGEGGSTDETEDETESGLLPFVSPALTIALIAIAGLVASLQGRKD